VRRFGRAGRILRGLAALAALAALIIGLPVLLWKAGGSPIPQHIPRWHQVASALLQRDTGSLFLAAVRDITWLAWAMFTLVTAGEVWAARRGRQARRVTGLGGLQNLSARLVALVALAFSSAPSAALAASAAPAAAAVAALATGIVVLDAAHAQLPAAARTITVQPGSCLWTLARHYLGSGDRWREIFALNRGKPQPYGDALTDPGLIRPGWNSSCRATRAATTRWPPTAAAATTGTRRRTAPSVRRTRRPVPRQPPLPPPRPRPLSQMGHQRQAGAHPPKRRRWRWRPTRPRTWPNSPPYTRPGS